MASLNVSEYSDSFEVEEALSIDSSDTELGELASPKTTLMSRSAAGYASRPPVNAKRKPPQMATGGKIASTAKGDAPVTSAVACDGDESSRFQAAVRNVQTIQSVARRFSDSTEVRKAVYSEWLEKKKIKTERERSSKSREKKEKEEGKRKVEAEKAKRVTEELDRWSKKKEETLQDRQKKKKEEARRAREAEEEKASKLRASAVASQRWREEQEKEFQKVQREKKRKIECKEAKHQAELAEKAESTQQAFLVWEQRKTESIRERRQREKKEREAEEAEKRQAKLQQKKEAHEKFDAWKNEKDASIKRRGSLYTYTSAATRNPTPWCPVRSIKYKHPKPDVGGETAQKKATLSSRQSLRSASVNSVYSCDFPSAASSVSGEGSVAASPTPPHRGTLKTIQLCCQTVEYWCTCDDC